MTTRLLGLGAKVLGGRALTARAVWRARGGHLELTHGLLKRLHCDQGSSLDLESLERGLEKIKVEAEPLLDNPEIGDAAVEFLQADGREDGVGELKPRAQAGPLAAQEGEGI